MKTFMTKVCLPILLGVLITNSNAMAEKEERFKEFIIEESSETIYVPADSLWGIVKQFDNVGLYMTGIDHSIGKGEPEFEGASCSERTCYVNLSGYNEVHERLTLFDSEKKELAYEFIGGGPSFLLFGGNHWRIEELGPNKCRLHMTATIRLKPIAGFLFGGKLMKTVKKELPLSMYEMKLYAETGQLSKSKKERMAQLGQ